MSAVSSSRNNNNTYVCECVCLCGEGVGTKRTLICGCRGMKVIHLYEGETKEL